MFNNVLSNTLVKRLVIQANDLRDQAHQHKNTFIRFLIVYSNRRNKPSHRREEKAGH